MPSMTREQIKHNFTYHDADASHDKFVALRGSMKEVALLIDRLCPESREKSLAITKLEECNMWANASIARNE